MIALLTWINTRGLTAAGKLVQNVFTVAKTGALAGADPARLTVGRNAAAVGDNFGDLWGGHRERQTDAGRGSPATAFGLFVGGRRGAQIGSLFSADAWNNITFTAGEVKDPRRNLPLSLAARHVW